MPDKIAAVVYKKVQAEGLPLFGNSGPLLRAIAFSPNASLLAGGFDREVKIWQLKETKESKPEIVKEEWQFFAGYSLNDDLEDEEELSFLAWTSMDFLLIGTSGGYVAVININDSVGHLAALFSSCISL